MPRIIGTTLLLKALVAAWGTVAQCNARFHAPLLATSILALGGAAFNILENYPAPARGEGAHGVVMEYLPTLVAIVATFLAEIALCRFF